MVYQPDTGQNNDATWRAQTVDALGGDAIIDGCGTALGGATDAIETVVEAGVVKFGNDYVPVDQQTVTHVDGDADDPRVDLVTVDDTGTASRITGTPAPADPSSNKWPTVYQPVPSVQSVDRGVVVSAAVWIPPGTTSSAELGTSDITPREVFGDGISNLDLTPGRDLQAVLDNAREGEVLRGDRSLVIDLPRSLTCSVKNVTIRGANLRYEDGAAQADDDDMLTFAADGISLEDSTLDGNAANQSYAVDGLSITQSDCAVENCDLSNHAEAGVAVDGTTTTVEDTSIENVSGSGNGKLLVDVFGTGTVGTDVETLRNTGGYGALRVIDGPSTTTARDIKSDDSSYVAAISDSGQTNGNPVKDTTLETLRGDNVRNIVNCATSKMDHQTLLVRDAQARNIQDTNKGVIEAHYIANVRIDDVTTRTRADVNALIEVKESRVVKITDATLANRGSNTTAAAEILLFDVGDVNITGCSLEESPNAGIRFQGDNEGSGPVTIGGVNSHRSCRTW